MKTTLSILAAGLFTLGTSQAAVSLFETFSYPNGSLVSVSGGNWVTYSGTAGQVDVGNGVVNLTQAETEDVAASLSGGPFTTGNLYASFYVRFSALPAGSGNYFAHLKDATATGARARIFATAIGAAPGSFRIGVANGSVSDLSVVVPMDLDLNTDYVVGLRYNVETPASTLWINPTIESDLSRSVTATDVATALPIVAFGLRQNAVNGVGVLAVDNLTVGQTFVEAVPEPQSLAVIGGLMLLVWTLRRRIQ